MDQYELIIEEEFSMVLELTQARYPTFCGTEAMLLPFLERYNEPWREFHGTQHIAEGFVLLRSLYEFVKDPIPIWWAWLGHDVIFLPGIKERSEMASALYTAKVLRDAGLPLALRFIVATSIHSTWEHLVPVAYPGNVNDLMIMHDVDLSGIGAPFEEFDAAGGRLRTECDDMAIPKHAVEAGEMEFCKRLLLRKRIFQSPHFTHLERQARKNLSFILNDVEVKSLALQ